jgi:hypothetical protein
MSLLSAFTSAVFPVLAVVLLGYLLSSRLELDVESLNAVALYAFLPALVFHSVATSRFDGHTVLKLFAAVGAFVGVMLLLGELAGRAAALDEPFLSGAVLASAFGNAGFYGIPLAEFAFGSAGRATAVVFMTAQSVLMYTVGVYVASRGGGRAGLGAAREVFRLPLIYAVLAASLVRGFGLVPSASGTAMSTLRLVGDASIPLMLLIVGVRMADLRTGVDAGVLVPTAMKLLVAPAVGAGVVAAFGFEDPTVARVFVLLCATPVAVVPLALTIAYGDGAGDRAASEYLTSAILVTTVASVVVLTALIAALRSGVFP